MRGTHTLYDTSAVGDRFIPAHAGNTVVRYNAKPERPVHPRACGEHAKSKKVREAKDGSSPRMRGTHCEHKP